MLTDLKFASKQEQVEQESMLNQTKPHILLGQLKRPMTSPVSVQLHGAQPTLLVCRGFCDT